LTFVFRSPTILGSPQPLEGPPRNLMERRILHFRVISFAVAVARALDPSLRGRPVVVATGEGPRSIVLAVSEEARGDGVRRGLVLPEALRRCRRARVLRPDPDLETRAARAVVTTLSRFTPLVEPERGGRFFADLTGTHRLFGAAVDVAARVQKEIIDHLRLPANAGVAGNKLVSGVAARVIRPVGLCDVRSGEEASFLKPVAVRNLPAVDPEVEGRLLSDLNVLRAGQLALIPGPMLADAFGRKGPVLHRQACGLDDAPVRPPKRSPEVVETMPPLPEDTNDDEVLRAALRGMIARACRKLRERGWRAARAEIAVRHSDGMRSVKRTELKPPLDGDWAMLQVLRPAFDAALARRQRVRTMTLRLTRLGPAPAQLLLFDDTARPAMDTAGDLDPKRERALLAALDRIRAKHGERVVAAGPGR